MAALAQTMDVAREIRETIDAMVREAMAPWAVRGVEIHAGEDHYGDPALFIDVRHDLSPNPIDPKALADLDVRLWLRLLEMGEDRFPFVRHDFAEDQKVVGYK